MPVVLAALHPNTKPFDAANNLVIVNDIDIRHDEGLWSHAHIRDLRPIHQPLPSRLNLSPESDGNGTAQHRLKPSPLHAYLQSQ